MGAASYEIFLLQILWFGLVASVLGTDQSLWLLVPSTIVCCPLGYALHLGMRRTPPLKTTRLGRLVLADRAGLTVAARPTRAVNFGDLPVDLGLDIEGVAWQHVSVGGAGDQIPSAGSQ